MIVAVRILYFIKEDQFMDWNVIVSYLPRYWDALLLTLRIGWQGVFLAFIIGILSAVVIHLRIPVLRRVVGFYIELFRNTPLLVQLFFIYFALPKVGLRISAETCGWLGLGLLGGAYMAETFRSGLENIAPIQTESALSLGMDRFQAFRYVILPQAVSSSVPGLLANVIFLLKETSVFSTVSLLDLMFTAKDLIGLYAKTIECLTLLVAFYLIMLLPVSLLGSVVERRLRRAEFGD
jgi:polar amino acid transport system permease protein